MLINSQSEGKTDTCLGSVSGTTANKCNEDTLNLLRNRDSIAIMSHQSGKVPSTNHTTF